MELKRTRRLRLATAHVSCDTDMAPIATKVANKSRRMQTNTMAGHENTPRNTRTAEHSNAGRSSSAAPEERTPTKDDSYTSQSNAKHDQDPDYDPDFEFSAPHFHDFLAGSTPASAIAAADAWFDHRVVTPSTPGSSRRPQRISGISSVFDSPAPQHNTRTTATSISSSSHATPRANTINSRRNTIKTLSPTQQLMDDTPRRVTRSQTRRKLSERRDTPAVIGQYFQLSFQISRSPSIFEHHDDDNNSNNDSINEGNDNDNNDNEDLDRSDDNSLYGEDKGDDNNNDNDDDMLDDGVKQHKKRVEEKDSSESPVPIRKLTASRLLRTRSSVSSDTSSASKDVTNTVSNKDNSISTDTASNNESADFHARYSETLSASDESGTNTIEYEQENVVFKGNKGYYTEAELATKKYNSVHDSEDIMPSTRTQQVISQKDKVLGVASENTERTISETNRFQQAKRTQATRREVNNYGTNRSGKRKTTGSTPYVTFAERTDQFLAGKFAPPPVRSTQASINASRRIIQGAKVTIPRSPRFTTRKRKAPAK